MGRRRLNYTIVLQKCPLCGATHTYKRTEQTKVCCDCDATLNRIRVAAHNQPTNPRVAFEILQDVHWLKKNLVEYVKIGHRVPVYLPDLELNLRNTVKEFVQAATKYLDK